MTEPSLHVALPFGLTTSASITYTQSSMEQERIRPLNRAANPIPGAYALYWMQSAQRPSENPALSYAARWADTLKLPLAVVFTLADYPDAAPAHYRWMLAGLRETADALRGAGMGFRLVAGETAESALRAAAEASIVVVDRSPARWSTLAKARLAARLSCPVIEVDGESVVPEAVASGKREWSARTFRARISGAPSLYASAQALPVPCPKMSARALGWDSGEEHFALFDEPLAHKPGKGARRISDFPFEPGPRAASERMARFIGGGLDRYDAERNDPTKDGTSGLSPYLHFGQISPVEVLRASTKHGGPGSLAFAEQLVVRRELCRNYVRHCPDAYDAWDGLPDWSKAALRSAASDRRDYLYAPAQFESASTHDAYWNAAQRQLKATGVIHNYMRMYWGKMILAWSRDPIEAFSTARRLNDRYALDGRDPNGWAGVAWCFGLHDRPWPPRPVFGTVRSMSAAGLLRKFDANAYAARWPATIDAPSRLDCRTWRFPSRT